MAYIDPYDHSQYSGNNPNYENVDIGLIDFFVFMCIMTGIIFLAVIFMIVIYCLIRDIVIRFLSPYISLDSDDPQNLNNYGQNHLTSTNKANSYDLNKFLDAHFLDSSEIIEKMNRLPIDEQFYYRHGEDFLKTNPPYVINKEATEESPLDPIMTFQTLQFIEEEGARAWQFVEPSSSPTNLISLNEFTSDDNTSGLLNRSVIITDKTDIQFKNSGYDVSTYTNLPIPYKKKVYYYECKILELNDRFDCTEIDFFSKKEIISIGLSTLPYPDFRLPGRHHHSVSYDSNGDRRLNTSFELSAELVGALPTFKKGDMIGVGYRCRSGTVFFTKNGKKIKEHEIGHIRKWRPKYLYPCIGANMPCKLQVNFGSRGFVYIEANSKKWGYGSTNGDKLPPPAYNNAKDDLILEEGYSEDENDFESYNDGDDCNSLYDDESDEYTNDEESNGLLGSSEMNKQASKKRTGSSTINRYTSRKKSLGNRNMNMLPPAPYFDFDKTNESTATENNEQISLSFLPPSVPPEYTSE
ncbi:unnamed protein product [Hanseniaspora opuntiae]